MGSAETAQALTYGWAVILGLIQGLTEFLPVSSSGHLALAQHLGFDQPLPIAFDVLLHVATVLVVLGAFGKDLLHCWREERIVLGYVLAGTVATVAVVIPLKDRIEALRESPLAVCGALLLTAAVLAWMEYTAKARLALKDFGWGRSIAVGLAQAVAVMPGVSRSGATIAGGSLCGLERDDAMRFSFFLMIPAVCGAAVLKAKDLLEEPNALAQLPLGPCAVGFVVAGVSGLFALKALMHLVREKKLLWFSGYCALVAVAGFVYWGVLRG